MHYKFITNNYFKIKSSWNLDSQHISLTINWKTLSSLLKFYTSIWKEILNRYSQPITLTMQTWAIKQNDENRIFQQSEPSVKKRIKEEKNRKKKGPLIQYF